MFKFILDCLLSFIYDEEEECALCNDYSEEYLCLKCKSEIKSLLHFKVEGLEYETYSYSYYTGKIKEVLLKGKYKSDFSALKFLSYFLIEIIKEQELKFDLITYVPISKKSLQKRGYNQCKVMAKEINKNLKVPVKQLLLKYRDTKDQIGLDSKERWENLKESIKFNDEYDVKNKTILLIDDVITTGATVHCCGDELIKNGAEKIIVLTVCKSNV